MSFVAITYENNLKVDHIKSTQSKTIILHPVKLPMNALKTNNINNVNSIGEIK